MTPEEILALLNPAEEKTVEEIEAELNVRLDELVQTLTEAYDDGARDLASASLAMALLAMTPGEVIDLALMASLRLAEQKIAARSESE